MRDSESIKISATEPGLTVFQGNSAYAGGALHLVNCNAEITNVEFVENTAANGGLGGAAIYLQAATSDATATITNTNFVSNTSRYGSAISAIGDSGFEVALNVTGGSFSKGGGDIGSAIYGRYAKNNIADAVFANNGTGGSVLWLYGGETTLTDTKFESNKGTKIKTEKDAIVNEITTEASDAVLDEAFAELFSDDLEILF